MSPVMKKSSQDRVQRALQDAALREAALERKREAEAARKRAEAEERERLRRDRARPRMALPAAYQGETMYIHRAIYDNIMKRKDITITRMWPKADNGKHSLVIEYSTRTGRGTYELNDLGPKP
ncbi:hypothetical protein [Gorillibacterium sp. sgz5001074]|uniref:hypothetical protein n=1 Tax=Gorillibacterium sp. sgz5001074 TaxID=3446695 RepID=UPI003F669B9F